MSNSYTSTEWIPNRTIATADVMNNMEEGILNAHQKVDELDSQVKDIENKVNAVNEILNDLDTTGDTDCSVIINQAIDYVSRIKESEPSNQEKGLGSYEIKLPAGKIRIDSPIEIVSHGIIISGCGRHGTILINNINEASENTDIALWNSATIRNKNIYSYRQKVLIRDLAIDLGDKNCVGIDMTSIGQSDIERVAIFGTNKKGIGIKCSSLKNESDEQVAGHLNTIINCTAQDVNIGVLINGGSNMNRVMFGEYFNNDIGVKIDNRNIEGITGGATVLEAIRFENNTININDNSQYTRICNNYFDGAGIGVNLEEKSYFPYLQSNHFSSAITTRIVQNGKIRNNTVTENYIGQYKGESFEFANSAKFYGGVGTTNLELRNMPFKCVKQIITDAYFSTPGYFRLSNCLTSNPTVRNCFFLDTDFNLCFMDKNGTKKKIAFQ